MGTETDIMAADAGKGFTNGYSNHAYVIGDDNVALAASTPVATTVDFSADALYRASPKRNHVSPSSTDLQALPDGVSNSTLSSENELTGSCGYCCWAPRCL